ncbi:neuronal pentraxin-1-like [Orbicella faveolata]|uniref:neuronal pentraxin-1-like n=1 Tax=Orbicella faveolata TaxID=48498 RepID=UPI0009E43C13|nr:neuronal pentraxin-1-like [Orbicella faveolata]
MRSLKAFTVCLWMSSSDTQGTPFSYATSVSDLGNELLIEFHEHFSLVIDGQHSKTTVSANDGVWHHICVSWERSSGSWTFYKDGKIKQQGQLKAGHTIREGGSLVLGQDQDSVGGGFDADQSFKGMLSNVNVWDHKLTDTRIEEMSKSCLLDEWNAGNVYRWGDFLQKAPARLVKKSLCNLSITGTWHNPHNIHFDKYQANY